MLEELSKGIDEFVVEMEAASVKHTAEADKAIAFHKKVLDGDKEATEQFTKKLLEDMFPNS